MNEAILRLAKEAGFDSELMEHNHNKGNPSIAEKFAELIVQECADIAKHHVMNISTYADADFVEKQIREHFGVEE